MYLCTYVCTSWPSVVILLEQSSTIECTPSSLTYPISFYLQLYSVVLTKYLRVLCAAKCQIHCRYNFTLFKLCSNTEQMLGANPTIVSYNVGGVQKISSPQIAFLVFRKKFLLFKRTSLLQRLCCSCKF
jgi:hypothetical protein